MKWYLNRKVNYYPFDISLVNLGYTRYQKKNFGFGFKNTFYFYQDGVEYSYRGEKDMEDLRKFLTKKFNKKFVAEFGKKIKINADKLLLITGVAFKSREALKVNFTKFCEAYKNFFSLFQLPELCQILLPNQPEQMLRGFGMARDYAARQLVKAEKIYRHKLGLLLGKTSAEGLMLLPEEVQKILQNNTFPQGFKNRKISAILTLNNKISIYWDKKAQAIFKKQVFNQIKQEKSLVGKCAFPGSVKGKAYVALTPADFKNIPQDCILVCSMTRYDIVPQLKKVKAIVTDQGGITCHAAIISRELKIPTLIATGTATEVFKTGDLVEVDPNKGVVRKI